MTRIYVTPLKEAQTTSSDEGVRAQIQQAGLLQEGGTATEKIAAENIDLVVSGQFRLGQKFSKKLADELNSLGESDYAGLPFYNPNLADYGRNSGFYEVQRVDTSPSHPVNQDAFEYTLALTFTGTRETHWRAVKTTIESVQTGLATGSDSLVGLPSTASKVRWFNESAGKEAASVDSTVSAEYGDVDLYDPTSAPFYDAQDESTNPILLYETAFGGQSPVDVRVYDDRGLSKYYTVGGSDYNQWTHAYHTAYEFEGNPVVDNGRLRLRFDEANSVVEAYEWDDANSVWSQITVSHGDYELVDADFEQISPSDVRVFTEWYDTVDDRLEQVVLSVQRGLEYAIARYPPNTVQTSGLESVIDAFVGGYTSDNKPGQGLRARSKVK